MVGGTDLSTQVPRQIGLAHAKAATGMCATWWERCRVEIGDHQPAATARRRIGSDRYISCRRRLPLSLALSSSSWKPGYPSRGAAHSADSPRCLSPARNPHIPRQRVVPLIAISVLSGALLFPVLPCLSDRVRRCKSVVGSLSIAAGHRHVRLVRVYPCRLRGLDFCRRSSAGRPSFGSTAFFPVPG